MFGILVSQFTLYATMKGTKPDFHYAMQGDRARPFFDDFVQSVKSNYQAERVQSTSYST